MLSFLWKPGSLRALKNRYDEVVIVGSGPTTFDYDFSKIHEPVFFINDMHRYSAVCPSKDQYFFTHHITKFPSVQPTTIHIERMYYDVVDYRGVLKATAEPEGRYIGVDCQASEDVANEYFFKEHPWLLDRDEVAERNRLLAFFGSITTVIHAAWYVGAKKVTMIGCNPDSPDARHDQRVLGKMLYQPEKIKQSTRILPEVLHMNVVHL